MGSIRFDTHPELHLKITEGNQQRQFELLRDMVSVGLVIPFGITEHTPLDPQQVDHLMRDYFTQMKKKRNTEQKFFPAACGLW